MRRYAPRFLGGLVSIGVVAALVVGELSVGVIVPMLILATLGWLFSFVERDDSR